MNIILAGTGNPAPLPERGGTSIHVSNDSSALLLDCGPGAVHSLVRSRADIADIEHVFFTHHHFDHTSDIFHFIPSSATLGRQQLTLYGPEGTEALLDAYYTGYKRDIAARESTSSRPRTGLTDVECERLSPGERLELPHWTIETLEVEHVEGLQTFAYRVEEKSSGDAMVFTGDTRPISALEDFSRGAEVLIHDAGEDAPYLGAVPRDTVFWEKYAPIDRAMKRDLANIHSTPEEAAATAEAAGVGLLVLTHIRPYRDTGKMRRAAEAVYDGNVVVAEDGLQLATGNL